MRMRFVVITVALVLVLAACGIGDAGGYAYEPVEVPKGGGYGPYAFVIELPRPSAPAPSAAYTQAVGRRPLLRNTLVANDFGDSFVITADGEVLAFGGRDREVNGEWIWEELPTVSILSGAVAISGPWTEYGEGGEVASVRAITADGNLWRACREEAVLLMENATELPVPHVFESPPHRDFVVENGRLYRVNERVDDWWGILPEAGVGFIMDNVAEFVLSDGMSSGELKKIITADGALWAFGLNGSGLFGDDPWYYQETPVHIMDNVAATLTNGWSISWTTLIYRADGSLWEINRWPPIEGEPVKVLDDVVTFAQSGGGNWLAVTADGGLWRSWLPEPEPQRIMENMRTGATPPPLSISLTPDQNTVVNQAGQSAAFGIVLGNVPPFPDIRIETPDPTNPVQITVAGLPPGIRASGLVSYEGNGTGKGELILTVYHTDGAPHFNEVVAQLGENFTLLPPTPVAEAQDGQYKHP